MVWTKVFKGPFSQAWENSPISKPWARQFNAWVFAHYKDTWTPAGVQDKGSGEGPCAVAPTEEEANRNLKQSMDSNKSSGTKEELVDWLPDQTK
jgi:hypothetical protein